MNIVIVTKASNKSNLTKIGMGRSVHEVQCNQRGSCYSLSVILINDETRPLLHCRDSGNDFIGYPKASFLCRLCRYPTRNEARLKSVLPETTRNEACLVSFPP